MTKAETRDYNRDYYQRRRSELLEKFRAWKANNRERHRASSAAWQAENKADSRGIKLRWKKANPEKVAEGNKRKLPQSRASHAERQRVRNRMVSAKDDAIRAVYVRSASVEIIACHWCGTDTKKGERHVDHVIPLARGGAHTADNAVIACCRCNLSKGAKDPLVFASARKEGF